MKNILVIDRAQNCVYDIFAIDDEGFARLFPGGTDIAFSEDFDEEDETVAPVWARLWKSRVAKAAVHGIHGTLFFGMEYKKAYYPTRKDEEAVNPDGTRCRQGGASSRS